MGRHAEMSAKIKKGQMILGTTGYLNRLEEHVLELAADCDAYDKRIAELEALVGSVKAESLRVVEVAGADYCVWCDGSGSWLESEYESGGVCVGQVENTCIHCLGYRKPVRLERWGTE